MLSETLLKIEIKKAEDTIKCLKEGLDINELVLKAFQEELEKCTPTP